jgi:hypothetical protein
MLEELLGRAVQKRSAGRLSPARDLDEATVHQQANVIPALALTITAADIMHLGHITTPITPTGDVRARRLYLP